MIRGVRVSKTARRNDKTVIVITVFVISVLFGILVALASGATEEDTRETRTYGNLTCVYNVTQDKIEACSE